MKFLRILGTGLAALLALAVYLAVVFVVYPVADVQLLTIAALGAIPGSLSLYALMSGGRLTHLGPIIGVALGVVVMAVNAPIYDIKLLPLVAVFVAPALLFFVRVELGLDNGVPKIAKAVGVVLLAVSAFISLLILLLDFQPAFARNPLVWRYYYGVENAAMMAWFAAVIVAAFGVSFTRSDGYAEIKRYAPKWLSFLALISVVPVVIALALGADAYSVAQTSILVGLSLFAIFYVGFTVFSQMIFPVLASFGLMRAPGRRQAEMRGSVVER